MASERAVDPETGRRYLLDFPGDTSGGELTFLLNLHGGGSAGMWQREYFPAHDFVDAHRLVVASPSARTKEPTRHWAPEADDGHLQAVVAQVLDRFGSSGVRAVWLVGHSQGGMTANRLLHQRFFADRVDGWLSLSGGRIGRAAVVEGFGPPRTPDQEAAMARFRADRLQPPPVPETDLSFVFATGEHEIVALPETSPLADRYGAGPRVRLTDVVDVEAGRVHDDRWGGRASAAWGGLPGPGTAQVFVYPEGRDGRVIADVVRLGKGHTEGLEPRITEELVKLMVAAPGGKAQAAAADGRQGGRRVGGPGGSVR